MINLNIIEKVKQELHLTKEQSDRYLPVLKKIDLFLEKNRIFFAENNLLAFTAHTITLFTRLETGEKVAGIDEEVLSQLDPGAIAITRELMDIIEKSYGVADEAEMVLAAIHIQTALEMIQEGRGI